MCSLVISCFSPSILSANIILTAINAHINELFVIHTRVGVVGNQDVGDGNNGQSSGYHSSAEDGSTLQQQLSAVEVENQLLRNEVASLNQEMQSVVRRTQSSNEGSFELCSFTVLMGLSLVFCFRAGTGYAVVL